MHDSDVGGQRGDDRTNNHGGYMIFSHAPNASDGFWVLAQKKIIKHDGEKIFCKGGRSKVLRLR